MLENDAHAMIWRPAPSEQVRYEYFNYDLRSNGGGDRWGDQWVQNYTGVQERLSIPEVFATKSSAFAKTVYV